MTEYNQLQSFVNQIELVERRIQTLETSSRLFSSGIGAGGINVYESGKFRIEDGGSVNIYDGGNLEVYGTSTSPGKVNIGSGGKLVSQGPVTFGGSSTFGGAVSIKGNLTITGNLSIKNGLIKSNALKNQMSGARDSETRTGFNVGTGWTNAAEAQMSVPSWATKVYVYTSGSVNVIRNATGITYSRVRIGSQYSSSVALHNIGASDTNIGTSNSFTTLINNPGKTINSSIQVGNGAAYGSNGSNRSTISMLSVFYR